MSSILQILVGAVGVVGLGIDHGEVVIGFWASWSARPGPVPSVPGLVPALLLAIGVAKIFESDPIIRTGAKSFFKISDRFVRAPLARGEKSKIVPGSWGRCRDNLP